MDEFSSFVLFFCGFFFFHCRCQIRMEKSSLLFFGSSYNPFVCFHFFDKWGLSGRQGFSPLNYPFLQSSPQVSFVFIVLCYFFNSLFGGLSDRLRCNSLSDDLFQSTPLALFVVFI